MSRPPWSHPAPAAPLHRFSYFGTSRPMEYVGSYLPPATTSSSSPMFFPPPSSIAKSPYAKKSPYTLDEEHRGQWSPSRWSFHPAPGTQDYYPSLAADPLSGSSILPTLQHTAPHPLQ